MRTMHDPAHPGESLRDAMAAEGWTVTEAAAKLGCTRQDLLVGAERESHPLWRWHWNESGGAMQRFGCAARRRRLGAGTYPPGTCMRWTRPAREPHPARIPCRCKIAADRSVSRECSSLGRHHHVGVRGRRRPVVGKERL